MKRLVALMGGHLLPNDDGSEYHTSTLDEWRNPYGLFGDNLRSIAAAMLYQKYGVDIIVIGGVTPLHKTIPQAPHLSHIIKKELMDFDVSDRNIMELDIDPATGTFEQLRHLASFLSFLNKKSKEIETVLLLSNRYQLPRIWAMILFQDRLAVLNTPIIRLIAAEDILIRYERARWFEPIAKAYQREAMRWCIQKELNGAKMIADGSYKFPKDFPQR